MSDATVTAATMPVPTIRPDEAAHFGAQAARWWDPAGPSGMLHRLNPVRLAFTRAAIDAHFGPPAGNARPLAGRRALDVGCGAGLACEPLARLGAAVTGIDAAPQSVAVAREHAANMGLPITYHAGELAAQALGRFDLVTCFEVLEHVADKPAFLAQLARHVAPDGLLILSTPNRTVMSRALLVGAAEAVGAVPRGTHNWDDFVTLEELTRLLTGAGLATTAARGIAFTPARGLHLSEDHRLNIILSARHAGAAA